MAEGREPSETARDHLKGAGDSSGKPAVRVGVIGLGFMGSTHVRCYQSAAATGARCELAAVADRDVQRLTGLAPIAGNIATGGGERLFDPARVRAYPDPAGLIADAEIDAVSICTHTRSHVDLAIAALAAGKHVLIEKPLALDIESARRVVLASGERPDLVCMPAMVMRFWPGWPLVRDAIRSGAHGGLRALTLTRRGSTPGWSPEFYADLGATGGALFDLHVHDADFVLWCFGAPERVCSTGDQRHITTIYRYADARGSDARAAVPRSGEGTGRPPMHVVAEGGTDHDPGLGFHIRLTAVFERATIDFDLSRSPNLMMFEGGQGRPIPVPAEGPFDVEIRAFVGAVAAARDRSRGQGAAVQPVPIGEALAVIRLLHAEKRSMEEGREVECG